MLTSEKIAALKLAVEFVEKSQKAFTVAGDHECDQIGAELRDGLERLDHDVGEIACITFI